jgi:hypothetical protein
VALRKQELWNQLREADAASLRPRPSRLRRLAATVLGPDRSVSDGPNNKAAGTIAYRRG